MDLHLAAYCMIATQPAVCLLCNRRIKIPLFCALTNKLGICSRIAMILTELILLAVLALEVENVNSQSNISKKGSFLTAFAMEQLLSKKM